MKRLIIKTTSAVVVVVLSIFILSSCGPIWLGEERIFPEGYTGGFGIDYGSRLEYYWVETYEEAVEAMNLLKSHGSTFEETAIFSYEGELFDTKYCFKFDGYKAEYVEFGGNPYDRWAENVVVMSFGFFEKVTIDELVYSYIDNYDKLVFYSTEEFNNIYDYHPDISLNDLTYQWNEQKNGARIYYKENDLFHFGIGKNAMSIELSEECLKAVIDSIVLIGYDDNL